MNDSQQQKYMIEAQNEGNKMIAPQGLTPAQNRLHKETSDDMPGQRIVSGDNGTFSLAFRSPSPKS